MYTSAMGIPNTSAIKKLLKKIYPKAKITPQNNKAINVHMSTVSRLFLRI